ncbi:MAG: hypothetical protein ACXIVE_00220 [Salinarimonas sp.]
MKRFTLLTFAAMAAAVTFGGSGAQAQGMSCNDINPMLEERSGIIERINALGSEDVDPRRACPIFRELDANSEKIAEFLEDNRAWCQIPVSFVEGFMEDKQQVSTLRGQACRAAAEINRLEREAREGQGQFGGPGLTGRFPMPQGAL